MRWRDFVSDKIFEVFVSLKEEPYYSKFVRDICLTSAFTDEDLTTIELAQRIDFILGLLEAGKEAASRGIKNGFDEISERIENE